LTFGLGLETYINVWKLRLGMSVGRVKSTRQQFLAKGDFVLPFGIKPTRDQIARVEKKKKRKRKKR
jgi:hypothetical protein